MKTTTGQNDKMVMFESWPVPKALFTMAVPAIVSQLITLIYNMADTWFIGRTNNPYMVAAASLVATVFLMIVGIANLFGVGGGNLVVRLLGAKKEEEARKVASWSIAMAAISAALFSLFCLIFMNPLLHLLGASENTIGYARQYLFFVIVLGCVPTVLSNTMSSIIRNIGYSKEAGFGLSMGGILNVVLDPLFMFVLLPKGYEVLGAALATMLSNTVVLIYFIYQYKKLKNDTILELPRKVVSIQRESLRSVLSVGLPSACSLWLFDLTNIVINKLCSGHGDFELAAIGLVLKIERLPLNIGIGICLGMAPLIAYNYASGNHKRRKQFFSLARTAGLMVAACCVVLYYVGAPVLIKAFIEESETVVLGTQFLRARCFATPFMFLSFHMIHLMNAIDKGKISFYLAVIRQLCLNIPMLFLFNALFGVTGVVWTQVTADIINVIISYIIYYQVMKKI